MIDWLVQSMAAHPDLAAGAAPAGVLSLLEQRRLASIPVAKRRSDWLLGRWTAKRLMQSYVMRRTGHLLPLDMFSITSDPDGAPRVVADWPCELQSAIKGLQLSISHSNGHALCAITDLADAPIGVDIERIEPRGPEFAADFFTPHEQRQIAAAAPAERDTVVTLIWSAKESALKALRLGLTIDTRCVSCSLGRHGSAGLAWWPLTIDYRLAPARPAGTIMHGWWRIVNEFVLTLVVNPARRRAPDDDGRKAA
ncbi:MAG: 4'-phosphopantetheinyl transferase superfamily protein [Kouleothrix sp.]|jgi:4'-phosphopantetheinyl transferase|nr:4'-phosphopantetheinyl transferase superfamily protein [Kouleothrix sp.]